MYNAFTFKVKGVNISELSNEDTQLFVEKIMILIRHLNKINQPYNIIALNHSIHIIPRQIETNIDKGKFGFCPAMVELFGVFIVKDQFSWNHYK